jgi:hypothetical protein
MHISHTIAEIKNKLPSTTQQHLRQKNPLRFDDYLMHAVAVLSLNALTQYRHLDIEKIHI